MEPLLRCFGTFPTWFTHCEGVPDTAFGWLPAFNLSTEGWNGFTGAKPEAVLALKYSAWRGGEAECHISCAKQKC